MKINRLTGLLYVSIQTLILRFWEKIPFWDDRTAREIHNNKNFRTLHLAGKVNAPCTNFRKKTTKTDTDKSLSS